MVASIQTAVGAYATRNGEIPCEGTKTVPFTFDFSAFTEFDINFEQQQQAKLITSIQGLYIDNSLNLTNTLVITVDTTGQRIVFPQKSCGYIPILAPVPAKLSFVSAGAVVVGVQVLNFYIPPTIWSV